MKEPTSNRRLFLLVEAAGFSPRPYRFGRLAAHEIAERYARVHCMSCRRKNCPAVKAVDRRLTTKRPDIRTHRFGTLRALAALVALRLVVGNAFSWSRIMLKAIGAFFVCMWAADFVTGFIHWMEDTYCLEHLPLIGGFICEPNIQHHIDPLDIVRDGTFFSRNVLQWVSCSVIFLGLCILGLGNCYSFMTLLFASFGNEVHRWNHTARSGPVVSFIKETGLIQMQRQHSLHHKPPYAQYYCALTSQVNPILERLRFWRRLESVVAFTTGITPQRENRRDAAPKKMATSHSR